LTLAGKHTVPTVQMGGCRKSCLHRDSIPEPFGPYSKCTEYTILGPFLGPLKEYFHSLKKYNPSFRMQEKSVRNSVSGSVSNKSFALKITHTPMGTNSTTMWLGICIYGQQKLIFFNQGVQFMQFWNTYQQMIQKHVMRYDSLWILQLPYTQTNSDIDRATHRNIFL